MGLPGAKLRNYQAYGHEIYNTSKIRRLSTTLLFTLRADSKANQVQTHQEAGLHKQWIEN